MEIRDSGVIELKHVSKQYAEGIYAVWDLSFALPRGKLLALLGPSGCGKTTALRLIAGLETPDTGEIWLNGQPVAAPKKWTPPEARRIGMVFQDYALFPHLTISQNVAFPIAHYQGQERNQRVTDLLDLVGMSEFSHRYPHQLSGGQQQRVALARALASNPAVVLLDEPFSNLDAALRKTMREEVREILRVASATAIFVTHDQEEALSIADEVAVMDRGAIRQMGTPQQIYFRPATPQIASFVGEANFLPGVARGQVVECALGALLLTSPAQGDVVVMIRPEALKLKPDAAETSCVEAITFYGHDQVAHVCVSDGLKLQVRMTPRPDIMPATRVHVSVQGPVVAYPASDR